MDQLEQREISLPDKISKATNPAEKDIIAFRHLVSDMKGFAQIVLEKLITENILTHATSPEGLNKFELLFKNSIADYFNQLGVRNTIHYQRVEDMVTTLLWEPISTDLGPALSGYLNLDDASAFVKEFVIARNEQTLNQGIQRTRNDFPQLPKKIMMNGDELL